MIAGDVAGGVVGGGDATSVIVVAAFHIFAPQERAGGAVFRNINIIITGRRDRWAAAERQYSLEITHAENFSRRVARNAPGFFVSCTVFRTHPGKVSRRRVELRKERVITGSCCDGGNGGGTCIVHAHRPRKMSCDIREARADAGRHFMIVAASPCAPHPHAVAGKVILDQEHVVLPVVHEAACVVLERDGLIFIFACNVNPACIDGDPGAFVMVGASTAYRPVFRACGRIVRNHESVAVSGRCHTCQRSERCCSVVIAGDKNRCAIRGDGQPAVVSRAAAFFRPHDISARVIFRNEHISVSRGGEHHVRRSEKCNRIFEIAGDVRSAGIIGSNTQCDFVRASAGAFRPLYRSEVIVLRDENVFASLVGNVDAAEVAIAVFESAGNEHVAERIRGNAISPLFTAVARPSCPRPVRRLAQTGKRKQDTDQRI